MYAIVDFSRERKRVKERVLSVQGAEDYHVVSSATHTVRGL